MAHVLRWKGTRFETFESEQAAADYLDARKAREIESNEHSQEHHAGFTIEPEKPIRLLQGGVIVESYATAEEAAAAADELARELAERWATRRRVTPQDVRAAFTIEGPDEEDATGPDAGAEEERRPWQIPT